MDKELRGLLEALADIRSPTDRCQFCDAREDTPVGQIGLHLHQESCPRRRAALLLAEMGTPLKMWRVSYDAQKGERVGHAEQLVMRCDLSEQDALTLVHRILERQGKRQLVPGSLRIEEGCLVPC